MLSRAAFWTCVVIPWAASISLAQETPEQADAVAAFAKIDGKVKFDPAHPKRVISIDL